MRIAACIALIVMATGTIGASFADEDPGYKTGPWHFKSVSCVDTTVTEVTPRLENAGQTTFTAKDLQDSGVIVSFKTGLGVVPLFAKGYAEVVHYQGETGNGVMAAEHAGDRVQVCFLGGPAPTQYCDPDKDDRGRRYRVYDYQQQKQYWGMNSEHDCGGA